MTPWLDHDVGVREQQSQATGAGRSDRRPRVLAIGGLDPCGGAGIVLDARMVEACGGFALTVAACLTVQNRRGLRRVEPLPDDLFAEMLEAALDDGPVDAVKTGLLGSEARVQQVAELFEARLAGVPRVVDPVLGATAGGWRAGDSTVRAYRERLAPRATVLTPNRPELAAIAPAGAAELLARGCGAVLETGGHGGGKAVEDHLWAAGRSEVVFHHPRLDVGPVHGTGCALAAALACGLGRGLDVEEACRQAVAAVARSLAETAPSADGLPVPLSVRAPAAGATGRAAARDPRR